MIYGVTRQINNLGSIRYTWIPPSLIISFIFIFIFIICIVLDYHNYLEQYGLANLTEKSQEWAVPELKNFWSTEMKRKNRHRTWRIIEANLGIDRTAIIGNLQSTFLEDIWRTVISRRCKQQPSGDSATFYADHGENSEVSPILGYRSFFATVL